METVESSDFIFKIIAVGNASVGKTSLTLRYATNSFQEDYRMTLGLNLTNKNVEISYKGEDTMVQLSIWDTGGQKSFRSLLPMYYKGALGALIVYDLTKTQSFEDLDIWVNEVREHCGQLPIIIIGNKSDLKDQIEISTQKAEKYVEDLRKEWKNKVFFFETSAKEDVQVDEAFVTLATTILHIVDEEDEVDEPQFEGLMNS